MTPSARRGLAAVVLGAAAACGSPAERAQPASMDVVAEGYVKLVLAVGQHDAAYVDAYYGPPEWKSEAEQRKRPLAEIDAEAARLIDGMGSVPVGADPDDVTVLRHVYLRRQLDALRARVRMLGGAAFTFDEESLALYDAVAPVRSEFSFQMTLTELEQLLPGRGPLIDRYDRFRKAFIVAPNKLGRVFDAAIAECRKRTLPHAELPAGETFTVEVID